MEESIRLDRLRLPGTDYDTRNTLSEVSKRFDVEITYEVGNKIAPFRKEPCIKLRGSEENVQKAKRVLLEKMEIQSNRVVLKMDIPHFEHSSLIGKCGKLNQKVMDETNCHIHFPDVNLYEDLDKSNHVSISGSPADVERARIILRALIPVQIFFKVPETKCSLYTFDCSSPQMKYFVKECGFLLYSFKGEKDNIMVVRCNQDKFQHLRKEIVYLMELICNTKGTNLPPVHIVTDIMSYHQPYVKGNENSNIEEIMKRTGAQITFPDTSIITSGKSSVTITGNLDCVYMAWREIQNLLPLNVSFDVMETRETKGDYMEFLHGCGISVYTRAKEKYHVKTINVRGPEKFSKQMLQYRQHLLRLPTIIFSCDMKEINVAAKIIDSYNVHNSRPSSQGSIAQFQHNLQDHHQWQQSQVKDSLSSDYYKNKMMAIKAMRRPIATVQVPSSLWAGHGFSQSMPATKKENLLVNNSLFDFDYNEAHSSSEDSDTWERVFQDCVDHNTWAHKGETIFSHSNYFDFLRDTEPSKGNKELNELLWKNGLHKYIDIFTREEIDYGAFLILNDEDFQNLGIPFQARMKLLCLIRELQNTHLFSKAPGAERISPNLI